MTGTKKASSLRAPTRNLITTKTIFSRNKPMRHNTKETPDFSISLAFIFRLMGLRVKPAMTAKVGMIIIFCKDGACLLISLAFIFRLMGLRVEAVNDEIKKGSLKEPKSIYGLVVDRDGIEPPTQGFSVLCSTN